MISMKSQITFSRQVGNESAGDLKSSLMKFPY